MNIWITDAEFKHTLGIVRELGQNKSYNITVIGRFDFAMSRFSIYSNCFIKRPKNINLTDFLLNHFDDFDFVIGVGAASVESITKSEKLRSKSIVPNTEQMTLSLSKEATYNFCNTIGVPAPRSIYPDSLDLDILSLKDFSYPLVIKAKYEMGGNVVQYVDNFEELKSTYSKIVKQYQFSKESLPLIQEFIKGQGCAYFAFYQNGVLVDDFMHKRIMEYPLSGGYSVKTKSYHNETLKELGRKVLDKLKWNGVAMVEFKEVGPDKFIIMEINPKYWGSTDLALSAGANFPTQMIKKFNSEEIITKEKKIITFMWPLTGYISNIITKPSLLIEFLIDLFNPNVKNNIIHKDVLGSLGIFINLFGDFSVKLIKKVIK